jgi:c-di-GMP-related signal transduction protein
VLLPRFLCGQVQGSARTADISKVAQLSCTMMDAGEAPVVASGAMRHLARQPILDAKGRVVAYELLSRNATASFFTGPGDAASRTMIDNTMMYGLAKLTAGLPAFLNCTADTLSNDFIQVLPPLLTVLEIVEDVKVSPAIVEACTGLHRKGYRIALDDFEFHSSLDPLIRIADFLKIDFRTTPAARRRNLMSSLPAFKGTYLAEKVETRDEYERARKEGFTLFQGYYFCKPLALHKKAVPSNRGVHFRLLRLLTEDPLDIAEIGELVKSEPSLAYRLLRYVNSAACGIGQQISSIQTALLVVGDDLFRRMATLAAAVELNVGPSPEILRMALVRARFCEAVGSFCKLDPAESYLLGLFSLLDAMLQMPMEEAIAPLSLSDTVRHALMGTDAGYRCPILWLESFERGNFSRCDELAASRGLAPDALEQQFSAATLWADQLLATG